VEPSAKSDSPVSFLHYAVHNPRKLFLRKAAFQIHLWAGILVSLYVVIIALSGSILVFEDEFTRTTLPSGLSTFSPAHVASLPDVMQQFHRAYPGARAVDINTPWPVVPAYRIRAMSATGREFHLVADSQTATLHEQPRTWVDWVHDLHVFLLLNSAYGEQACTC
jgi:uncharacterized iron-regulated membrane protein